MDSLTSIIPCVIKNLKERHPELVKGMDDEQIEECFFSFHGEHDLCIESLKKHINQKIESLKLKVLQTV